MKSKIPRNSHHIVLLLCIVFICSLITIHILGTNKEGFKLSRDCLNLFKKTKGQYDKLLNKVKGDYEAKKNTLATKELELKTKESSLQSRETDINNGRAPYVEERLEQVEDELRAANKDLTEAQTARDSADNKVNDITSEAYAFKNDINKYGKNAIDTTVKNATANIRRFSSSMNSLENRLNKSIDAHTSAIEDIRSTLLSKA
jgi:chromosome segregation ATPase